jgi:hypothetical protein
MTNTQDLPNPITHGCIIHCRPDYSCVIILLWEDALLELAAIRSLSLRARLDPRDRSARVPATFLAPFHSQVK